MIYLHLDQHSVPTTNNGQEGYNSRLNTLFASSPQIYRFCMQVMEELDFCEQQLEDILTGKKQAHNSSKVYAELKNEREKAKKLLISRTTAPGVTSAEKKNDLHRFMGRLGALSAKIGKAKVCSDFSLAALEALFPQSSLHHPHSLQEQSELAGQHQPTRGRMRGLRLGNKGREHKRRRRECDKGEADQGRSTRGLVFSRPAPVLNPEPRVMSNPSDSVTEHIEKHQLNLQHLGLVSSTGDSFYHSVWNLVLHYNIDVDANDVNQLRKLIVNHIKKHPRALFWKQTVFKNNGRLMNSFIITHSYPGTPVNDSEGIIVHSTADMLSAKMHIVHSSDTAKAPVTIISPANPLYSIHIGCQVRGGQSRHFVSLIPKPVLPVEANLHKISAEKKILDLLYSDSEISSASLKRLKSVDFDIGSINTSDIFQTMERLHAHYGRETETGVLVRQVIRKMNNVIAVQDAWNTNLLDVTEEVQTSSVNLFDISTGEVADLTQVIKMSFFK